jgi:hypothetical protein
MSSRATARGYRRFRRPRSPASRNGTVTGRLPFASRAGCIRAPSTIWMRMGPANRQGRLDGPNLSDQLSASMRSAPFFPAVTVRVPQNTCNYVYTLTSLSLSQNAIGAAGAASLARLALMAHRASSLQRSRASDEVRFFKTPTNLATCIYIYIYNPGRGHSEVLTCQRVRF